MTDSCDRERRSPSPTKRRVGEETRGPQGRSRTRLPAVQATGNSAESKSLQKQQPQGNTIFRKVQSFFYNLFLKNDGQGQERNQRRKPTLTSTNFHCPSKDSLMEGETPEAQALMLAVGRILEEKMAHSIGLQRREETELRGEYPSSAYGPSCPHRARFNPEQGQNRVHVSPGTTNLNTGRAVVAPKRVHFANEPIILNQPPVMQRTVPRVCLYERQPRDTAAHRHYQRCPRHCFLRGGVLSSKP